MDSACLPTQFGVGIHDRALHLLGNFLHVDAGGDQIRVPKVRLDISRIVVPLEVRGACPPEGLVRHAGNAGFCGQRFENPLQVIPYSKWRARFAREEKVGFSPASVPVVLFRLAAQHRPVFDFRQGTLTSWDVTSAFRRFSVARFPDAKRALLGLLKGLVDTNAVWFDIVIAKQEQFAGVRPTHEEGSQHSVFSGWGDCQWPLRLIKRIEAPARLLRQEFRRQLQFPTGIGVDEPLVFRVFQAGGQVRPDLLHDAVARTG